MTESHLEQIREAFTVGYAEGYDQRLRDATDEIPLRKVGQYDDYPGGWVWRTADEARAFLATNAFLATDREPEKYAVYRLELPTSWEADVSKVPGPRGVHNLLNDARIVHRVDDEARLSRRHEGEHLGGTP